jgi:uncharacterized OsmC-like protein
MRHAVLESQAPLRASYKHDPDAARVVDHARRGGVDPRDPFHSQVEPMDGCGVQVPIGVHRALGGTHDAPTPGDLLCAALAACQDSPIRMVANLLGVELESLEVRVKTGADVRGALAKDNDVPVGFQSMCREVDLQTREGTSPELLQRLRVAAERSCVVLQTLRRPPPVEVIFRI